MPAKITALWLRMFTAGRELEKAEERYFDAVKRTLADPAVSNKYKKELRAQFERTEFKMIGKNKWGYYDPTKG